MSRHKRSAGLGRSLPILLIGVVALAIGGPAIRGLVEGGGEAIPQAEQDHPAAGPQRVSIKNGEHVITLDAAAQRQDGIATAGLKDTPHQQRLRAFGTVLDLKPLTEFANGFANAKARLQMARAKLAASQTAFERAEKLYKDQQNMSAAQLQAAEALFRVDQAGLAVAELEQRTLVVTAQQSWGAVLGEAVANGGPLLERLVARQDALIQITLRPGQTIVQPPASAYVQLDDSSRVPLQFVSAATKTDPRIQGLSFFFTAPVASPLLPGMSVVALLATGRTVIGAVVPPSAILWEQGRAWAFFRTGPDRFARRTVATDLPTPDGGYLVQGLPDNSAVVVQGAQMLLSEEFRARVPVED